MNRPNFNFGNPGFQAPRNDFDDLHEEGLLNDIMYANESTPLPVIKRLFREMNNIVNDPLRPAELIIPRYFQEKMNRLARWLVEENHDHAMVDFMKKNEIMDRDTAAVVHGHIGSNYDMSKLYPNADTDISKPSKKRKIEGGNDAHYEVQQIKIRNTVGLEQAQKHFKNITKKKPRKMRETKNFYVFRVHPPTKFVKGTFRTKVVNKDIQLVVAELKSENANLSGGGFGDFFKRAYNTVSGAVSSIASTISNVISVKDYSSKTKDNLDRYGDIPVVSLEIRRKPLNLAIDLAFETVSTGQWGQLKKKYGFDKFYHLSMVVTLQKDTQTREMGIEKLEVVSFNDNVAYKQGDGTEVLPVVITKPFTVKQMFDETRKQVGDSRFFSYSGVGGNNCQDFIAMCLTSVGLYGAKEKAFTYQDMKSLTDELPYKVKAIARGVTQIGAIANKYLGIGGNHTLNSIHGEMRGDGREELLPLKDRDVEYYEVLDENIRAREILGAPVNYTDIAQQAMDNSRNMPPNAIERVIDQINDQNDDLMDRVQRRNRLKTQQYKLHLDNPNNPLHTLHRLSTRRRIPANRQMVRLPRTIDEMEGNGLKDIHEDGELYQFDQLDEPDNRLTYWEQAMMDMAASRAVTQMRSQIQAMTERMRRQQIEDNRQADMEFEGNRGIIRPREEESEDDEGDEELNQEDDFIQLKDSITSGELLREIREDEPEMTEDAIRQEYRQSVLSTLDRLIEEASQDLRQRLINYRRTFTHDTRGSGMKCWKGKVGTKVKNGKRVNNCVKNDKIKAFHKYVKEHKHDLEGAHTIEQMYKDWTEKVGGALPLRDNGRAPITISPAQQPVQKIIPVQAKMPEEAKMPQKARRKIKVAPKIDVEAPVAPEVIIHLPPEEAKIPEAPKVRKRPLTPKDLAPKGFEAPKEPEAKIKKVRRKPKVAPEVIHLPPEEAKIAPEPVKEMTKKEKLEKIVAGFPEALVKRLILPFAGNPHPEAFHTEESDKLDAKRKEQIDTELKKSKHYTEDEINKMGWYERRDYDMLHRVAKKNINNRIEENMTEEEKNNRERVEEKEGKAVDLRNEAREIVSYENDYADSGEIPTFMFRNAIEKLRTNKSITETYYGYGLVGGDQSNIPELNRVIEQAYNALENPTFKLKTVTEDDNTALEMEWSDMDDEQKENFAPDFDVGDEKENSGSEDEGEERETYTLEEYNDAMYESYRDTLYGVRGELKITTKTKKGQGDAITFLRNLRELILEAQGEMPKQDIPVEQQWWNY